MFWFMETSVKLNLWSLVFLILYIADIWNDLENKIILYADDTTFYAEVTSPFDCINVANSLNRDLVKIQSWYSMWGITFNPRKTHSLTIN